MDAMVIRPAKATGALPYALILLGIAATTIAGAFIVQAFGFPPCELCLKERLPFYFGIALAGAAVVPAWRGPIWGARVCFALLALVFVFSAGFGVYHAGVEWGLWPGPSDCTGTLDRASSNKDFLRQLNSFRAVRCDAVAIRILGLSLAGWNALISLALATIAALGAFRASAETAG